MIRSARAAVFGLYLVVGIACVDAGPDPVDAARAALHDGRAIRWAVCPEDFLDECAWVPLPLDYARPEGDALPIFVSRRLAPSGEADTQLWLLQGGPGGSGNVFKDVVEQILAPSLPNVDFYVLEQRGVGESARLGCPAEDESSPGGPAILFDEWPACIAAMQAQWGDGLDQLTTTADAHDLAQLIERTREPDKQVLVYGLSYGTTRAMRLLQTHPDAADGVILDSIVSPGVQFISQYDTQYDPVARKLSELCAADALCQSKLGPDPWITIPEILARLDAGHCQGVPIPSDARRLASTLLGQRDFRVHLLALLYRLDRCAPDDVQVVEHYLTEFDRLLARPLRVDRMSNALSSHITFSELWEEPAPSAEELRRRCGGSVFCPSVSVSLGATYADWPRYERDEYVGAWPEVTTPILAMNGTLDPQTPIENAIAAASELSAPHQSFVAVPGSPHGVLFGSPVKTAGAPTCGVQLLSGFVADPTAAPNSACLDDLAPVEFTGVSVLSEMLFGTPDIWENTAPVQLLAEGAQAIPESAVARAQLTVVSSLMPQQSGLASSRTVRFSRAAPETR